MAAASPAGPLLRVDRLLVSFGAGRARVDAVRGLSFDIDPGTCLAIVGESGSGKSATARALVGLAGPDSWVRADRMELAGTDLTRLDGPGWRRIRGSRVGLVLQDALSALDPLRTVGAEVAEVLRNHRLVTRREVGSRAVSLLAQSQVPEPELRARQHPHELSGGLRQRAVIAAAMAAGPPLLVADEPTTALDVPVAARILDLLAARKAGGTALLLISHDLSVVARLADRVAVIHRGRFVEEGPVDDVLRCPVHPYTRQLLAAVPGPGTKGRRLMGGTWTGRGAVPTDPGCSYTGSCPLVTDRCRREEPPRVPLAGDHSARCWRTGEPWPDRPDRPLGPGGPAGPERSRNHRDPPALSVESVWRSFPIGGGRRRVAARDVSFDLREGETLGVLGESGSGKTTVARVVMGLLEPDAGTVRLFGRSWSGVAEPARRPRRSRIQFVQQNPLASFDPRYPVGRIIGEGLAGQPRTTRTRRIAELLDLVGLDEGVRARRPRQLSGGQLQRVALARALAPEPDVLVCDEPVSALDVSVQAQILDLLADIQDRFGLAMLFISHDLGVIYHVSDRVLVMRDGRVVDGGPVGAVFARPRDPYSRDLLGGFLDPDGAGPAGSERPGPLSAAESGRAGGAAAERVIES